MRVPLLITILSIPFSFAQTFTVTSFTAYIPSPSTPLDQQHQSWATFKLQDGANTMTCTALTLPYAPLFSNDKYWPCNPYEQPEDTGFYFIIGHQFGMVGIAKVFKGIDGNWLTGFANQGTYWKEGEGGNVTAYTWGKGYDRPAAWKFEVTRMTG